MSCLYSAGSAHAVSIYIQGPQMRGYDYNGLAQM